jgi:TRAP-type C4-dicarboxylate transport system substrate-binding protein
MNRRDLIKFAGSGAAALGVPGLALAQGAYKAEYKMSTVVPPAFAWGKGGEIFANLVRERTAGRINIKQYPFASLVQGQQDREFSAPQPLDGGPGRGGPGRRPRRTGPDAAGTGGA